MPYLPRHRRPSWTLTIVGLLGFTLAILGVSLLAVPDLSTPRPERLALGRGAAPVAAAATPSPAVAAAASPATTATASPPTATAQPPAQSPAQGMTEVTQTVTIGAMPRSYVTFLPAHPAAPRIPELIVLHGIAVTPDQEAVRDGLLVLADLGQAVLVYPTGYLESWNGGSCCGSAYDDHVDDVGFVAALLQQAAADPSVDGVYLAGYSDGGKAAYRVACADPTLMTALIVVSAVPGAPCQAGAPVTLLQVATATDPRVSYNASSPVHVTNGYRETNVTAQVADWRVRDGCAATPTGTTVGALSTQVWSCSAGTGVQLATYASGDHAWPPGGPGTPSASQVIWAFIAQRPTP